MLNSGHLYSANDLIMSLSLVNLNALYLQIDNLLALYQ